MDLRVITADNDLTVDIQAPISGALTKAKIDSALVDNGYSIPLQNKVSFHFLDWGGSDRVWLVTWFPALDKYGIISLTLKG